LILLEGGARFIVFQVLHQGKLFQNDPVLGWRPVPGLTRVRKNADGGFWKIRTNEQGFRSPAFWADSSNPGSSFWEILTPLETV